MKLGRILTIILLLALLAGAGYGIYAVGYPYLEDYLAARKPIDPEEKPPEETIMSISIDRISSDNLYSGDDESIDFQFYEGEIDWGSVHLLVTYGDSTIKNITLTEDMLSGEDLEEISGGGVNSFVVDIGGKQVVITIKIIPRVVDTFYSITFDTQGGSEVASIKSDAQGRVFFLPSYTKKTGFEFKGWYNSNGNLVNATPESPLLLTDDLALQAKWRDERTYDVTFLRKDGTVLKVDRGVEHGHSATPPRTEDIDVIEGWVFEGWSEAFNNITSNKTIQATYTQLERKIIFRSEVWGAGGSQEVTVFYGDNLPTSQIPQVPVKEGYTAEWSRKTFNNIKENIYVDAIYEIITFTVTFKSTEWAPEDYVVRVVNYGATLISALIPALPPAKTGYNLAWENVSLENIKENKVVNAIYTPIEYKITFRRPYTTGAGGEHLGSIDVPYDSHIVPIDTGKDPEFFDVKWYNNSACEGAPIDFDTYIVKGPATFYVQEIDLRSYNVTFIYNLGEEDVVFATIVVVGEGTPLKPQRPAAPNIEGYTFDAWSVPEDYAVVEHTTVYAYYTVNYYMVKFYERSTLVEEGSKAYGTAIAPPAGYDTEREDFIFDGWFTSPIFAEGTKVDFEGLKVKGASNFYAKWINLDTGSEGLEFGYVEISAEEAYYEVIGYSDYSDKAVKIPSIYEGLDVKGITADAFADAIDITSIELPSALEFIGDNAFISNYALVEFITKDNATDYIAINGILYSADSTKLVRYPASKDATGFVVPPEVKSIEKGAFATVGTLISLQFATGSIIESIGELAFSGCFGLAEINLPGTLQVVGNGAFKDCLDLATITGGEGLASVGKKVFENTVWLEAQPEIGFIILATTLIRYNGSGEIVLPNTITTIADGAFEGKLITKITINDTSALQNIGKDAFKNCVRLETINLLTADMPEIGTGAFSGVKGNATLYVPTDLLADYESNPMVASFVSAGKLLAY